MAGRPTKFEDWMCDRALELLSQGKSLTYVAADIGISRETIYAWKDENPLFSDAIKIGLAKAQAHWEDVIEQTAKGINPEGNPATIIFTLKNRFREDWPDTQDIKKALSGGLVVAHKDASEMTDAELESIAAGRS